MVRESLSLEEMPHHPQKQMEAVAYWYQREAMDLGLRGFHIQVLFQEKSWKELHHRYGGQHLQHKL